MRALILAAGEGTRLRPLTSNIPKPLLMVAGRPFLSHTIEAVREAGVDDIVLLVGWKGNLIKEHYGDGSSMGVSITYLEQRERKGTAHAIGMAEGEMDDDFICLAGDVIISAPSLREMMSLHRECGCSVIGAVEVDDPSRFGVIETEGRRMRRILEKPSDPPSDLINGSAYVFEHKVFDHIRGIGLSPRGEYEITDALNSLVTDGVMVHRLEEDWIDVGQPWDLLEANARLMARQERRIEGEVEEGAVLKGNVVVEEGALVRAGSYIEGPVYIAKGCDIGPNCYIRPSTAIGPGCRVGAASEVKNTIIMGRSNAPHHNYVGDSVIGTGCNLGSGTKVANLRFDGKNVKVVSRGRLVDSGRRKLGVVMGDDVNTGINSMVAPGTVIWERAVVGPGAKVKGEIGPDTMVF